MSNAVYLQLTWVVTFPGNSSITFTYDAHSIRNTVNDLGMNVSATLTKFRASGYIESVIKLTVLGDAIVNGTLLECNLAGYESDQEKIAVNTSGRLL